jgi:hypothetical protein
MARCAAALCSGVSEISMAFEKYLRFLALAHQVEDYSRAEIGLKRQRHALKCLAEERQRVLQLAFAHQLLALLGELRLLRLARRGLRQKRRA